jgi:phenylacetate-coenzyme A ligase PaaK-like adenylate-forming protein/acyl carrier protein
MIYTSGSTGRPKGAMNTHQGIVNRLLWMQDTFRLTAEDRVLQKTPFSFDVSVWEFFWPLLSGACLVVARPEGHRDPAYLVDLINEQRITTLHFVPSMLQAFLEAPKIADITSLRRVICSGEALSFELQERFFSRLDAELHNLYGPTEAAVDVTAWQCQPTSGRAVVPLGYPVANTQVYVLDDRLQPVPVGVSGEIYLGGVQLARGYYRRADLTAERFIPNPFAAGTRLYQTGDLGRYLADGAIEYLGRRDFQVKLRGFRIELGEIEAVLHEHEAIREAVVVAHETTSGTSLTAYIVPADGSAAPDHTLRDFLKERLPEYMVPAAFMRLPALPLTPNGKLDRNGLPVPGALGAQERPELASVFVAPRTPAEEKLAAIWAELLHVERVGIHDNFFALGGHSLLVTQVVSRIRETFNVEIPMRTFFQGPTVADLAMTITQLRAAQEGSDTIERMLAQISHLSPAQVQSLLAAKQGTQVPVAHVQSATPEQQPVAPAQPVRDALAGAVGEEYRCADIQRFPVGDGCELVSAGRGSSRILASETVAWLEQCTMFKTIDDHALAIGRRDSATDAHAIVAIEEQLRDLSKDGFLLSYNETLEACTAASISQTPPVQIATVAWPTCNRVEILQRCLTSYIENSKQYGKTNDYAILDDSQSAETRKAYQEMLRLVADQHKVRIFYGGIEQKTQFAERIIDTGDIPADIVRFALFGERQGPYRAGANVNALMLHTAGDPVLCVDDDTVGRVTTAPERTDSVSLTSGLLNKRGLGGNAGYPDEIWCFPDRETLLREIRFVETDLLGMHEHVLGQGVREYLAAARRSGRQVDVHGVDPQLLRGLRTSAGRVMVTLPGLVGDCGWGTPSNYLQFSGSSRERLVQSESAYHSACTSRELLRVAKNVTLAKRLEAMIGSCYGLDNRTLVPPSMPIAIGIDTVFGLTVSKCFDNGYFAHLPSAILHLPTEARAFWPGEIMRSASGIAFNTLISILINFFDFGVLQTDDEAKLRRLGHYLAEVGSLPAPDFEDLVRSQIQRGVSLYLQTLEDQLQLHHEQPEYWASNLKQFMTIMRQSLLKDEFYVPLDLLYGRSLSEARELTQHFVGRFGQLMHWWPDIVEVTRALRNQGYRLANPV